MTITDSRNDRRFAGLLAILRDEPEAARCARAVEKAASRRISAASFLEIAIVIAREAYRDFGKGSAHPAQLNFGGCFAYALAKITREPLLFKGDGFTGTDIVSAVNGPDPQS
jgi:ribonuclease VapC